MKPATAVHFAIETTLTNDKGENVGDVVKSSHADLWRSHFPPQIGMRLVWTVNGAERRWRVVGVGYFQADDIWAVTVTESRAEERAA